MRIISGKFKSRRFTPPAKNWPTRPTTDTAKEGLFNILNNRFDFEDAKMLDLFCGTGNHTYEFISRGCEDATCIDKFYGCIQFIKKTTKELGISDYVQIVKGDIFKVIPSLRVQYDYIFAGPPYPLPTLSTIPDLIFKHDLLKKEGLLVVEHNSKNNFEDHPNFDFSRNYGETIFSFFEHLEDEEEAS